ncbi:MmgE/PrpD family protein [Dongia sp.]|uniref:MmgE/PrpD family protein n=1 Tax=Dongia sp. TaxID=1977262 RepID=UPI0037508894
MTIARALAEFIGGRTEVPPPALEHAKLAVLDLATAALAGARSQVAQMSLRAARNIWRQGSAPVWFSGDRLNAPGAALANAASASALDLDDGHRAAAGHPGAAIIPAVFATAAVHRCNPEQILPAIVLGYEVAVRAAAARDFSRLTTLVSGPWVGYGVAAAASWLRGLPPATIKQALAIAGATAPNLSAIAYSRVMGNHIKEGIPWATASALAAVDFAAEGFTGPTDLFDNDALFDRKTLLDGLSDSRDEEWAIRSIYFKPYGCCRWAHAAIDAVLALQSQSGFAFDAVAAIEIDTFSWALRLNNEIAPKTPESAQYSLPFCVALALTKGADALIEIGADDLRDRATIALAGKVALKIDPGYDAMFPQQVPSRVRVRIGAATLVKEIAAPLGEPTNPMDRARLQQKFRSVAAGRLSPDRTETFLAAFERLSGGNATAVMEALACPLEDPPLKLPWPSRA